MFDNAKLFEKVFGEPKDKSGTIGAPLDRIVLILFVLSIIYGLFGIWITYTSSTTIARILDTAQFEVIYMTILSSLGLVWTCMSLSIFMIYTVRKEYLESRFLPDDLRSQYLPLFSEEDRRLGRESANLVLLNVKSIGLLKGYYSAQCLAFNGEDPIIWTERIKGSNVTQGQVWTRAK